MKDHGDMTWAERLACRKRWRFEVGDVLCDAHYGGDERYVVAETLEEPEGFHFVRFVGDPPADSCGKSWRMANGYKLA
jgi:hypothetical protein